MKTFHIITVLAAIGLSGCGKPASTTTNNPPPQSIPEVYRAVKPEDGIRYVARTQGEINRNGVVEEIGFHLYIIAADGKEVEVPLVSVTVSDGRVETKDFGILKIESNINSFTLLATESQIKKLLAFQSSRP